MAFHTTADALFAFLEKDSVPLWVAEAGGAAVESVQPPDRLALAVGNEGSGLSSSVRERSAAAISVPIARGVESLNVAVATAILLYQLRK
jgi:tRNA G18 (ribose-2'-O)-methylase SpoU